MFKNKDFRKAFVIGGMIASFIAGIITFIIGIYFIFALIPYGIDDQILFYGIFWSSFLYLGVSILYFVYKLIDSSRKKHQAIIERENNENFNNNKK